MARTTDELGFTLVELLVAMAVFGIVLAGVTSFLISGMSFSQASISSANRLSELNNASGYLVDNIRRAASIDYSVSSATCAPTAIECLALVVPESFTGNGIIDQYSLREYQLIPRSSVPSVQLDIDTWASDNTFALVEYQKVLCGPAHPSGAVCSTSPPTATIGAWSDGSGPYLVVDKLSSTSGVSPVPSSNLIELRLQVQEQRKGTLLATPTLPLVLNVSPRNTPP